GRIGRDLEQDATRLAEVNRMEVHAIDDRSDPTDMRYQLALPAFLLFVSRRPERNVMDDPGAQIAAGGLRRALDVENRRVGRAALKANPAHRFGGPGEPHDLEEPLGRRAVAFRERRAVETAQRVLRWNRIGRGDGPVGSVRHADQLER